MGFRVSQIWGVPFWGPYSKNYSLLGSAIGGSGEGLGFRSYGLGVG